MKCLKVTYVINLLLLLIFVGPLEVGAQNLCAGLFSPSASKADLFEDLNTNTPPHMKADVWQSHIDNLQTPSQYLQFLRDLQEFGTQRVSPKDGYIGGDARGDVGVVHRLQALDFVTPIIRFRDHLTRSQKEDFLANFLKIHQSGFDQSEGAHVRWEGLQATFKLALMPESLPEFIKNTSATIDFSKIEANFYFGLATRIAMGSIPAKIKQEAQGVLTTELQKEFLLNKDKDGKIRRRNLEVINYYLSAKVLLQMAKRFDKKSVSAKALSEWIDQYWAPLMNASLPAANGKYSFVRVIEVAKIIQTGMKSNLGSSYIEVYGSFPNMKANLATSDVDVHFGDQLMKKYVEAFGSENRNFSDSESMRAEGGVIPQQSKDLARDLLQTEAALAQFLNRAEYQSSELMTVVPIAPGSYNKFYASGKYQFYNAIKITVYQDRLELHVFDYFEGQTRIIQIKR